MPTLDQWIGNADVFPILERADYFNHSGVSPWPIDTVRAVGLAPDLLRALPRTLAPDQLYRLGLARALIARPKLMIVDDPADGFDPERRSVLVDLIDRVRSDYSLTLVATTRDFDVARALTDRTLVLDGGSVVEEGPSSQLQEAPQHATTRALVAARLPEVGIVAPAPAFG